MIIVTFWKNGVSGNIHATQGDLVGTFTLTQVPNTGESIRLYGNNYKILERFWQIVGDYSYCSIILELSR